MDGDHPADLALAFGHKIPILVMELVDQSATTWIGMLRDLHDEGAVHQAMDLIDLVGGFRQLEMVATGLQTGPLLWRRSRLAYGSVGHGTISIGPVSVHAIIVRAAGLCQQTDR